MKRIIFSFVFSSLIAFGPIVNTSFAKDSSAASFCKGDEKKKKKKTCDAASKESCTKEKKSCCAHK